MIATRISIVIALFYLNLFVLKANQYSVNSDVDSFTLTIHLPGNGITVNWSEGHVFKLEKGNVIYEQRFEIFSELAQISIPKNPEILSYRILYEPRTGKFFDIITPESDSLSVILDVFRTNKQPVFSSGSTQMYQTFLSHYDSFYNAASNLFYQQSSESNKQKNNNQKKIALLNKTYAKDLKEFRKQMKKLPDNRSLKLLIENTPVLLINPKHNEQKHLEFWKKHFWKDVDSPNPLLANSFLYPMLIERYLIPFFDDFEKNGNLNLLHEAIDQVMLHVGKNKDQYAMAYQFLFEGFSAIENNDLLFYLSGNYDQAETCNTKDAAENKETKPRLSKGFTSPNFEFSIQGSEEVTTLYEWAYDTVILVFWSSTCPHCINAMPVLYDQLGSGQDFKKDYGVITISADTDPKLYGRYRGHYPDWSHVNDFKGWESPLIQAFYIDATPTFVVLDKERKVIKKTHSVEQVLYHLPSKKAR